MFRRSFCMVALTLLTTVSVLSQNTPGDVSDLVGARASSGESELRSRGYRFVKTDKAAGRSYSYWWRSNTRTCLSVVTLDGRYDSIVSVGPADCNQNSGGNSGGNWNNGNNGGQVNPPSWARGTFYGTGPGGEQITLTISNNGSVTANVNGSPSYGSFTRGNYINLGGATASVTRNGNGITTTRTDNGERISYSRNSWNNGNDGGNWNNGNNGGQINPPSWARGTFYGTGPGGEQITLTISNNGSVTASVNGSPSYGSFTRGNYINLGGATSQVTRNGNGITTTRTDNRERISYSRNAFAGGNTGGGWSSNNTVEVDDLVGARASSGETQMRSRGFRNVDRFKTDNTSYTIWWRNQSRQCVQIATTDGRFDSVTDIGSHPKCN